jgi:hypothetical protein
MKLQKLGGIAAIASLCAYYGYVFIVTHFSLPTDPVKMMAAYSLTPTYSNVGLLLVAVSYILYLVFGLALYERMHAKAPYLMLIMLIASSAATAIGIMEAAVWIKGMGVIAPKQDISSLRALIAVFSGLHTAAFHIEAWSLPFVGWAILKTRAFSRILGWLSLIAGILLILAFIIPQLKSTPWFLTCAAVIWLAIELLLRKQSDPISAKQHTIS